MLLQAIAAQLGLEPKYLRAPPSQLRQVASCGRHDHWHGHRRLVHRLQIDVQPPYLYFPTSQSDVLELQPVTSEQSTAFTIPDIALPYDFGTGLSDSSARPSFKALATLWLGRFDHRLPYVDSSNASADVDKASVQESVDSSNSAAYGIPEALSFDRILGGGTCPPVTTRQFMDFLVYIEHSAENLQFYLWYRDYVRRFFQLPEHLQSLSPEWTEGHTQAERNGAEKEKPAKSLAPDAANMLKGTDFDPSAKPHVPESNYGPNPFSTPPRTPSANDRDSWAAASLPWSENPSVEHTKKTAQAFNEAEVLQPFTIQPFREEISRIIAIYLADGGARMLNLSSKERSGLLRALAVTTHPSAFREVIATVEWTLRHQAHPNFIRWTICNGNPPRQVFASVLGYACVVGATVYGIVITLSSVNRGWRALAFIGYFIGIATLWAAWKGMCIVLHGMHHRHLRPWELFGDAEDACAEYECHKGSFDSLGSSNSYESEPWVVKYEKRPLIRKIADREVWVQDPTLRSIQDTIFVQALLLGFIIGAIITAIFLAVPKGNFF
ncbi:hypothetical protein DV738_g3324, partial [Chaetothyriales sp. CBS 135597]